MKLTKAQKEAAAEKEAAAKRDSNRPAERDEQSRQIKHAEEKAGVNQSNLSGEVDSTKPPGTQGGDDEATGARAPRETGRSRSGPAGLSEEAPESDEPSEDDTTTANAPNSRKNKAETATHKENAIKASSKPKNEAADGPGNRAKVAASEDAEDQDDDDDDAVVPLDEVPAHRIPKGMGTQKVRITQATRALNVSGLNVLEELKRDQLRVGDEITVPDNVAQMLVDKNRAVLVTGDGDDDIATRDDVRRGNRDNPSPAPEPEDDDEDEDDE